MACAGCDGRRPEAFPGAEFFSHPLVELVDAMGGDASIAHAAWVSTGEAGRARDATETITDRSGRDVARMVPLINYLMAHKHGTPFEHAALTFRVVAPLFVWREHHRHRIGISYNEESGRYKELAPHFYIPAAARTQSGKPSQYTIGPGDGAQDDLVTRELTRQSLEGYATYRGLLDAGIAREMARMCLPVNLMSTCYVTFNPRSLMKFLELRAAPAAQYEIRQVADLYAEHFRELFPHTATAFAANGQIAP